MFTLKQSGWAISSSGEIDKVSLEMAVSTLVDGGFIVVKSEKGYGASCYSGLCACERPQGKLRESVVSPANVAFKGGKKYSLHNEGFSLLCSRGIEVVQDRKSVV